MTSISCENMRAASRSSKRSRTTARAMTMPAAPPNAWMTRAAANTSIEGATAQSSAPTAKTTQPVKSGIRRPKRSAMGP